MRKPLIIFIAVLTVIGIFIKFVWNPLDILPRPHSLKYNSSTFDPLAKLILQQDQITSMDDCTRHTKKVNNVRIAMRKSGEETDAFGKIHFYKDALDSLQISAQLFNELREQLENTKLRQFYRSGDSILFYVDGLLDHGWGFLYCDRPIAMDSSYVYFRENSVTLVGEVNSHWKKVSIY